MKRYQKTIECIRCKGRIVLKARQTKIGWTTNYSYASDGQAKIMCGCGKIVFIRADDDPLSWLSFPEN